MLDLPTRLVLAYGLIALLVIAGAAFVWWRARNTQHRRDTRARNRTDERYRERTAAAAAAER